ncbi:MAG: hypothetical protein Q7T16_03100 [Candidatus Burarchaeum sp.]|nr:hypothetical protein [Candidatus Burarchaeum sp.]MDO8339620.1 hypothetical protein [Candidatus Burarchaeum sp.]
MDEILEGLKRAGRAAFRTREYAALLGKPGYARLVLHRLHVKGKLRKVRNGWWAFPDALPESVACEISTPCYLSFFSALALHGLTTQMPRGIQLAVARKPKAYAVFGMRVKEFNVGKRRFGGFVQKEGLFLATPEKAFADCLLFPRACPQIVLYEALPEIDVEKVKQLALTRAAKARLRRLVKHAGQERD